MRQLKYLQDETIIWTLYTTEKSSWAKNGLNIENLILS